MKLSKRQEEIVNAPEHRVAVNASAGGGKGHPDYTMIPTPSGLRRLDSLQIGDKVFNRYGKITEIDGIFPLGKKQIYEVELSDGRIIECSDEHLWSYDNNHGGLTTKETNKMLENGLYRIDKKGAHNYKYRIPNLLEPVEFEEKKIDIDPYVIGCFIGDGCCREASLTISSNDEWLVNEISQLTNFEYKKCHPNNYSWFFHKDGVKIKTKEYFKDYLSELVCYCGEKRIPSDYLINSTENRLALLQGLMDTDGCVNNGHHSPTYSTTSYGLAEDVAFLARSLGFYSTITSQDGKDKKSVEYLVLIFTSSQKAYTIFRLPRKRDKAYSFIDYKQRINHKYISIVDIRLTDNWTSMRCIHLNDNEHLYLTNDFVVTHNTRILTERVRKILTEGTDPSDIAVITFTRMAAQELIERLGGDYKEGMFVGTIHSLAYNLMCRHGDNELAEQYINEDDFDKFFNACKDYDLYHIYDYIFVDEAMDSSEGELEFIFNMINPLNYFVCYDLRQSIFRFRGAKPELLIKYLNQTEAAYYELNENYRCSYAVLSFAQWVTRTFGIEDNSICMSGVKGVKGNVNFTPSELAAALKKRQPYRDWAILTRDNRTLDKVAAILHEHSIPYNTFKQSELTHKDLLKKMQEDKVTLLTVHSAKGLEWKNVITFGIFLPKGNVQSEADKENVNIYYVAVTRARENLVIGKLVNKKKTK